MKRNKFQSPCTQDCPQLCWERCQSGFLFLKDMPIFGKLQRCILSHLYDLSALTKNQNVLFRTCTLPSGLFYLVLLFGCCLSWGICLFFPDIGLIYYMRKNKRVYLFCDSSNGRKKGFFKYLFYIESSLWRVISVKMRKIVSFWLLKHALRQLG